ncbi:18474_t:CDS:1, partial [Gigaspora margarita]
MSENASLLAKEAGLMARIIELEQSTKENVELKAEVTKLIFDIKMNRILSNY